MATISARVETSKSDAEIYDALFAWFTQDVNFFHSPFVSQVKIECNDKVNGPIKLRIKEEMPLIGSIKLPMVANAVITGDRETMTLQSKTVMQGYKHVTVLVSFKRMGQNLVEITETLQFELEWFLNLPILGGAMNEITKKQWINAHRSVIESMKVAVADDVKQAKL